MKRFGIVVLLFSIIFFVGLVVNPIITSSAFAQQEETQNDPDDDADGDDGTSEDADADDDGESDDGDDADGEDSDEADDDNDVDSDDADDDDDEDADDDDAKADDDDEGDDPESDDDDADVDDDDADDDDADDDDADDDDADDDDEDDIDGNNAGSGKRDDKDKSDDDADDDDDEDDYDYDYDDDVPELKVYPKKAEVAVGETIKFEFEVRGVDDDDDEADDDADDGSAEKAAGDIIVTWKVSDPLIGSIDEDGLFTAIAEGNVTVTATAGTLSGTSRVMVTAEELEGEIHRNKMSLFRESPEGKVNKFGAPTNENDSITLGGFSYPLNIFNGSKLFIPENALSEDVSITIVIPEFADVSDTIEDVDFGSDIITGVNFVVSVDGVEVEGDYYFDEPLVITIPFKRGLLDKLGLVPEDLGMYFANDTGEIEGNGITDIVVDPDKNTITGSVPHFSTVVVAPKTAAPASVNDEETVRPDGITLSQNMPNPFNPATTISFSIPEMGNVTVDVFNIAGQRVDTLVSELLHAGSHTVTWNASEFSAGIYFYIVKSGEFSKTKKMMLLK